MLVRLSLLCVGAATATHAAMLRLSAPLVTVPSQPARFGQPSMHMPGGGFGYEPNAYEPEGPNWGTGGGRDSMYRARQRATRTCNKSPMP